MPQINAGFQIAQKHYNEGKFVEAELAYRSLLSQVIGAVMQSKIYAGLCASLRGQKKYEEAKHLYTHALAQISANSKQEHKEILSYKEYQLSSMHLEAAKLWYGLGVTYKELKIEAESAFKNCLSEADLFIEISNNFLQRIASGATEVPKGVDMKKEVNLIMFACYSYKANAQRDIGEFQEALTSYKEALKIDTEHASTITKIAQVEEIIRNSSSDDTEMQSPPEAAEGDDTFLMVETATEDGVTYGETVNLSGIIPE